ncbi:MAG: AbiV family abortive infection protein [Bifidobacteriaceae bacterium]|nr:AbiV family abortive infection protein [Bifidobacteriaceae bacterium]
MPIRRLPDLTPGQVTKLQDALLANAHALLTSALAVLDLGNVALARSLAILGLEESGKAIAVHERRVEMGHTDDGTPFRNDRFDELWASHERKLEAVHSFLVREEYWFDVEPADPARNAAQLGKIKSWSRRHDRSKQRGFYVEISKSGDVMEPSDVEDEEDLREIIGRVHQVGWQLRLGEHIEGKRQDQQEVGVPPVDNADLAWLDRADRADGLPAEALGEVKRLAQEGVPGVPLPNAAYRFNPPGADRSPFRNLGRPGYEEETLELMRFARELDELEDDEDREDAGGFH